jgi:putative ABC transport system permease protein
MVALPVLGMTTADVLVRTAGLSPEGKASRQIGQADAVLIPSSGDAVVQDADRTGYSSRSGPSGTPLTLAQTRALLPRGSRAITNETIGMFPVRSGDRAAMAEMSGFDYADPIATGIVRQRAGRAPQATNEVAVTTSLARTLGISVGDTVRLGAKGELARRVVGTYVLPESTRADGLTGLPGTLPPNTGRGAATLLVDLPDGTDMNALLTRFNGRGVLVQTRDMVLHPPPLTPTERATRAGLITVIVGLATLEVVLLAGAAFAVGARRQRRDLALIAATGADRRQVRSIVLGSGGVLGLSGGLVGVLVGLPLAMLARGPAERYWGQTLFGPLDVRPLELLAILLVGTMTGIAAAAWPARTAARADVVAALGGRRGIVRTSKWVTIAGACTAAVGAGIAAYGASNGRQTGGGSGDATGQVYLGGSSPRFTLILIGAIVAELGLVACVPAVLGAAGRAARWLPLAPRLALRDVARQRARSGPAVAAVMAALAGSVALSMYIASSNAYDEKRYTPQGRIGQAFVYLGGIDPSSPRLGPTTLAQVAAELPTRTTATIAYAQPKACRPDECNAVNVQLPVGERCPAPIEAGAGSSALRHLANDPRCSPAQLQQYVAVGGPDLVDAMLGHPDPVAASALRRGVAVALEPRYVDKGTVTMLVGPPGGGEPKPLPVDAVAVHGPPGYELPAVIIPPALAKQVGLGSRPQSLLIDTTRMPTRQEQARAQSVLTATGSLYGIQVERGFHPASGLVVIALVGAASLVTLGATVIATALAGAEAAPDLATLAAVGAAPRVRRLLAAAQAATIAGIGAAFGIGAGLVPGLALVHARTEWSLVVPWPALASALIGVPVIGALLAGIFTRSRLPMHARMS